MPNLKKITIHTTAIIEGVGDGDSYIEIVDGQFEKRFQQFFEICLPEDAVAFDIGANIGIISVILGKMRPAGDVFAFEAGEHVCHVLRNNIARNHLPRVHALQTAVANYDGTISFNENSAYGHAVDEAVATQGTGLVTVPCKTIDTLAATYSPHRLDLIKLDIEGFEPQALEGATRTIADLDPIFLMEINPWCIENYGKVNCREFVGKIFDQFKNVFIINKNWHEEMPLRRITLDELFTAIETSENLFVDDLVFSNGDTVLKAVQP